MSIDLIPSRLHQRYRFEERHHATSILATDFREEFNDILLCLKDFRLKKSDILTPGGGRSPIPKAIDGFLGKRKMGRKALRHQNHRGRETYPDSYTQDRQFQESRRDRGRVEQQNRVL